MNSRRVVIAGLLMVGLAWLAWSGVNGAGPDGVWAQGAPGYTWRESCNLSTGAGCGVRSFWMVADGQHVVYRTTNLAADSGRLYAQALMSGAPTQVGPTLNANESFDVVSTGGRVAAVGLRLGDGSVVPEIWQFDASQPGATLRRLTVPNGARLIGLSPDGVWLYYYEPGAGSPVWRLAMSGSGDPQAVAAAILATEKIDSARIAPSGDAILSVIPSNTPPFEPPASRRTLLLTQLNNAPSAIPLGDFSHIDLVRHNNQTRLVYRDTAQVLFSAPVTATLGTSVRLSPDTGTVSNFDVAAGQVVFDWRPPLTTTVQGVLVPWQGPASAGQPLPALPDPVTNTYRSSRFSGPLARWLVVWTLGSNHFVVSPSNLSQPPRQLPEGSTYGPVVVDAERRALTLNQGLLSNVSLDDAGAAPIPLNEAETSTTLVFPDVYGLTQQQDVLFYTSYMTGYVVPVGGPLSQRQKIALDAGMSVDAFTAVEFDLSGRFVVFLAGRSGMPYNQSPSLVIVDLQPPAPTLTPSPTSTPTTTPLPSPTATRTPIPIDSRIYLPALSRQP